MFVYLSIPLPFPCYHFQVLSESLDKDYNRKDDANEDFAYLGQ